MTKFDSIDLEMDKSNNIAIIFLNRPKQFNAFNINLAEELIMAFNNVLSDKEIRCLIITGRGKAFCSGGDVAEFNRAEKPDEFMSQIVELLHKGIKLLKNLSVITISAINGPCFGAGLGYASACDFRISSDKATFGCAFTKIGLSPDSSSTYHIPKLVGLSLANEMLFLNRRLNAEEALKYGLINRIFSTDSFMKEVKDFDLEISRGAPLAFSNTKKLINESFTNDLEAHLNREAENIVKTAGTEDFQEGLKAFFEKREPNFKGK